MQVVICALAKNEHLYINEWVNHYLKLGFDKIYIFDNDDLDSPYVGDFIENKEKIEIIDIRGVHKHELQHKIYTKFYNTYKFNWVFYCDIDEFLMGVDDIHKWLAKFPNAMQIRVKWRLFGDDDMITRDMSVPVTQAFKHEITESWNRALTKKCRLFNQGKSFVRGGFYHVVVHSPHFASIGVRNNVIPSVLPSGRPRNSKVTIEEDYSHETVYLNHYMTKTLSEFINQKLKRTDAVFGDLSINFDYFWRINKKTPEKLKYIEEHCR